MRFRNDLLGGRAEPRRPRTAILTALLMCVLLIAGVGALPASAVMSTVNPIETGQNITVFHNLDFIAAFGYGPVGSEITVSVIRNVGGTDLTIGRATGPTIDTPEGAALEVNHGPEGAPQPGDCWTNVTPDVQPFDRVQITEANGDIDEVTVDDIRFTDVEPVFTEGVGGAPDTITVSGVAFRADGLNTPITAANLDSAGFLETSKLRGGPEHVIDTPGVPGGFTMIYEAPFADNVEEPFGRNVDEVDEEGVKQALLGPGHDIGFGHVAVLPLEAMLVEGMEDVPGPALGCEASIANTDLTNSDADTLIDAIDNCSLVANEDQANSDTDALGDACDTDDDDDTVLDVDDNCALTANTDQANSDTDALGDACDTDDDDDTVLDADDNCALTANTDQANNDGDAQGDACDTDDDNDTISDSAEATAGTNPLSADSDGDGVSDASDACALVAGTGTDGCAPPAAPINTGGITSGGGGVTTGADTDGDGVLDAVDNCSSVSNADQLNSDADAQGNACDSDDDNDTVLDGADACPTTPGTTENAGCATPEAVTSSISIFYRARLERFRGTVGASNDACIADRDVVLKKMRRGADRVIGRTTTNELGKWRLDVNNAGGRYYAKVKSTDISGPGGSVSQVCGAATSNRLRIT